MPADRGRPYRPRVRPRDPLPAPPSSCSAKAPSAGCSTGSPPSTTTPPRQCCPWTSRRWTATPTTSSPRALVTSGPPIRAAGHSRVLTAPDSHVALRSTSHQTHTVGGPPRPSGPHQLVACSAFTDRAAIVERGNFDARLSRPAVRSHGWSSWPTRHGVSEDGDVVAGSNDVVAQPASTGGGATTGTWTGRARRVTASTGLPDRLPGVSGQSEFQRARVDLALASRCYAAIAAALSWPTDRVPELIAVTAAERAHGAALADRRCGRRRHKGPHRGRLGDLRLRRDRRREGRRTTQRSGGLPRVVRPDGRPRARCSASKAGKPL
jgi:hypothetical protein